MPETERSYKSAINISPNLCCLIAHTASPKHGHHAPLVPVEPQLVSAAASSGVIRLHQLQQPARMACKGHTAAADRSI